MCASNKMFKGSLQLRIPSYRFFFSILQYLCSCSFHCYIPVYAIWEYDVLNFLLFSNNSKEFLNETQFNKWIVTHWKNRFLIILSHLFIGRLYFFLYFFFSMSWSTHRNVLKQRYKILRFSQIIHKSIDT